MPTPSKESFLSPDDSAFSPSIPRRENYPEAAETPEKPNTLALMSRLVKNGELSKFISRGVYPSAQHEALTELQRKAESALAYPLLDRAAEEPKESEMRLLLISAYNIACWHEQRSRMTYRASKPVERETFEYVDPAKKFKLLIEEVYQNLESGSVVTVWKAWGREWSLEYEMSPVVKFTILTGPCLEFTSNCVGEITFADGDHYTTTIAPGVVSSLAATTQNFNYKGTAVVTNTSTGLRCETDLNEPGMLSSGKKHRAKGVIVTKEGKAASGLQLGGTWDQQLVVEKKGDSIEQVLWEADTLERPNRYNFGDFSVQLNHLPGVLLDVLPPTDSRLRPDIRAVELGQYAKADEELKRVAELNEKNKSKGEDKVCKGKWFGERPKASHLKYQYNGGYWEAREAKFKGNAQAWSDCPDCFGAGYHYAQQMASLAVT